MRNVVTLGWNLTYTTYELPQVMYSFAIYRFPYQKSCTAILQHSCQDHILAECSQIDTASGFVVAPFVVAPSCMRLLILPEEMMTFREPALIDADVVAYINACCEKNAKRDDSPESTRADYADDFDRFHRHLLIGRCKKLVLAREKVIHMSSTADACRMFAKACADYPRVFVALFSSPVCGTWLVATPEVLIERTGNRCGTMALAGTMKYHGDMNPTWSEKNIVEQACVESYIRDSIAHLTENCEIKGPYTVRAADLVHLRTDFKFSTMADTTISDLISALHPTPAVCGLPKRQSLEFILCNEHSPRRYYSGYCGPLEVDGSTHLYVSLRCMRIDTGLCRLYAGGGLLVASEEQNEWQETENKMQTMQRCLNINAQA